MSPDPAPESMALERPRTPARPRSGPRMGTFVQAVVFGLTALLWTALALTSPYFLTPGNILNIMRQVSIGAIIAIGETYTVIIAGIDLSVGGLAAFTGIIAAKVMASGGAVWPAVLLSFLVGTAAGVLNGVATFDLGIPPFIITLAGLEGYRGGALLLSQGLSIANLPVSFTGFALNNTGGIPNLFWVLIAVIAVFGFILHRTRTGRYLYAMGSSREAARRAGVNVRRMTYIAYGVSGFLATLGGLLLVSRLAVGAPTMAEGYELDAIAAGVVGGASLFGARGSVLGTFIGALLFTTIGNGTNLLGVDPFWQMVVEGVLIAIVVYIDNVQRRRISGQ
jgi:ribose transport system permease protein